MYPTKTALSKLGLASECQPLNSDLTASFAHAEANVLPVLFIVIFETEIIRSRRTVNSPSASGDF